MLPYLSQSSGFYRQLIYHLSGPVRLKSGSFSTFQPLAEKIQLQKAKFYQELVYLPEFEVKIGKSNREITLKAAEEVL